MRVCWDNPKVNITIKVFVIHTNFGQECVVDLSNGELIHHCAFS